MSRRILFVLPTLTRSGGVDVVVHYAQDLAHWHGHRTVVTTMDDTATSAAPEGVETIDLARARRQHFDVVVATHWMTVAVAVELDATCIVQFLQSREDRFFGRADVELQQAALAAQSCTDALACAPWIVEDAAAVGDRRVRYVPNPAPPACDHRDLDVPRVPIVVLEGSDRWFKGWEQSVETLRRCTTPMEVVVVSSDGRLRDDVVERLRANPALRQVRREDCLSHADFLALLHRATLLLKTSSVEGAPLPHMEALRESCVVVTTPSTGSELSIRHGHTGLVVGFDDVVGGAWLVDLALTDTTLRERLTANGRALMDAWPDRRASAALMHDWLEEVCQDPSAPGPLAPAFTPAWREYAAIATARSPVPRRVARRLAAVPALQPLARRAGATRPGTWVRHRLWGA